MRSSSHTVDRRLGFLHRSVDLESPRSANEMKRIAVYIDIEGFEARYGKDSGCLWSLHELMGGLFKIGENYKSLNGFRLFAHQIGDGFLIVDDFAPGTLERIMAVAIALMQYTLISGGKVCKSGIAVGELADVQGCYPECIREKSKGNGVVRLGEGLLRTFPVMGTALIRAVKVTSKISGPLLIVDADNIGTVNTPGIQYKVEEGYPVIDWIHSDTELIARCREVLGLAEADRNGMETLMGNYIRSNELKEEWKTNTAKYLNLESTTSRFTGEEAEEKGKGPLPHQG